MCTATFHKMTSLKVFFAFLLICWRVDFALGYTAKLGLEIGSKAEFRQGMLMRREMHTRDAQVPRATTTTTTKLTAYISQAKPNDQLCICNGCLEKDGLCRSVFFDWVPWPEKCKKDGGTWCEDKGSTLWKAPPCRESKIINFQSLTLQMFQVKLRQLPGKGKNKVKLLMTDMKNGRVSVALAACATDFPKSILARKSKSYFVQGYFEQNLTRVKKVLALEGVPDAFRKNTTFFYMLNVQDPDISLPDVQKDLEAQVVTGSMAGALRQHWSSNMSIAVALVTCPGSSLEATHQKVKKAFFTDFANALRAASHGKITVSGDVVEAVVACPAKHSPFSYYQAVHAKLTSNPIWTGSRHKAMVVPDGWMSRYGLAYSPGYLSFYNDLGGQDPTNIMHEIGHNLGLDHAAILPSNKAMGYDERGDCSSAMSKCGNVLFYTLASNWFLGFNTFQKQIDLQDITSPVSVQVTSYIQNEVSGVLLTRSDAEKHVPAYTVSFLRYNDAPKKKRAMGPFLAKVHVHELPTSAYGLANSIAILGNKRHTAYLLLDFSVAIAVKKISPDSANVVFCKAKSQAEAQACRYK